MGPHSFKCGKLRNDNDNDNTKGGFNGAAIFQVRKETFTWLSPFHKGSFNGAALFQVRKVIVGRRQRNEQRGFNGAALFQVRKDVRLALRSAE